MEGNITNQPQLPGTKLRIPTNQPPHKRMLGGAAARPLALQRRERWACLAHDKTSGLISAPPAFPSLQPVFEKRPEMLPVFGMMCEPERAIVFRVPWCAPVLRFDRLACCACVWL